MHGDFIKAIKNTDLIYAIRIIPEKTGEPLVGTDPDIITIKMKGVNVIRGQAIADGKFPAVGFVTVKKDDGHAPVSR